MGSFQCSNTAPEVEIACARHHEKVGSLSMHLTASCATKEFGYVASTKTKRTIMRLAAITHSLWTLWTPWSFCSLPFAWCHTNTHATILGWGMGKHTITITRNMRKVHCNDLFGISLCCGTCHVAFVACLGPRYLSFATCTKMWRTAYLGSSRLKGAPWCIFFLCRCT